MDPTVRNQTQPSSSSSSSSSSDTSFPILAISILGILTTVILLVSYYVFVVKCCISWRRADGLRRFRHLHRAAGPPTRTPFFAAEENRGLEESAIRSIPTVRFRRRDHRPPHECAVCLTEFREAETLRLLPGCSHSFHVDCIDTWLQSNANCPLCRSDVAAAANHHQLIDLDAANERIVIEVREEMEEASARAKSTGGKKKRVVRHGASMGDECIDVRCSMDSEQLSGVQPMRRSFSMDSSCDRRLYQSVQEILRKAQQLQLQDWDGEGSSSGVGAGGGGAKTRRSFFSFGHGRSSRSAVIPVQI